MQGVALSARHHAPTPVEGCCAQACLRLQRAQAGSTRAPACRQRDDQSRLPAPCSRRPPAAVCCPPRP
eukprot:2599350-Pleurochrysis_carterae.AAC.1